MVSVQQWKEELLISEKNEQILNTSNIMSQMTISYIKEVGNLLALTYSVRELTIERHLQAERLMLPNVFAFDHPNHGWYLTYQHVMLSNFHLENPRAWEELVKEGFGRSLSGQPVSTEHRSEGA